MGRLLVGQTPVPTKFRNASEPLTTVTYDGSGQVIHPDILDFGNSPFNGFRFWMVNTPYPANNDDYENPSIWVSNDALTWEVPNGLTNPICAAPAHPSFNSDPCIFFDTKQNKLRVFYRNSPAGTNTYVIRSIESTDGITWTNDYITLSLPAAEESVSPAVYLNEETGVYSMWLIKQTSCSGSYLGLFKYVSTDTLEWTLVGPVTLTRPPGFQLWHINLKRTANGFVGVTCGFPSACTADMNLYLVRSIDTDGNGFELLPDPLLKPGAASTWDSQGLYQSCLINIDGSWKLYYSGRKNVSGVFTNKLGLATS